MADEPISNLAAYSTLHGDDEIEVLDVHDTTMASTGTNKRATVAQVFGSPSSGQINYWNGSSPGVPAGASKLAVGGSGQLNFTAIAAPGSPTIGDHWLDSTQNCLTSYGGPGGLTIYRAGLVFSQTTNVTQSTPSSASLVSTSGAVGGVALPAGFLNVAGRTLRIRAAGYYSTGATSGTTTMWLLLGTNVFATSINGMGFGSSKTTALWSLDVIVTIKATGASGKIDSGGSIFCPSGATLVFGVCNGTTAGTQAVSTQVTLDLTAAYTLDFKVTSSSSGNSVTCTNLIVEVLA